MNSVLKYFIYSIAILSLLIVGFITYLLWLQPPFYFPKPTGPYSVGATEFHWIDTNCKETYLNDSHHHHRELIIRVWYPTESKSQKPTKFELDIAEYFKENQKLLCLLGLSRPMYSYVIPNASIFNNKSFPLIVFSPGAGGNRDSNLIHCTELASHGYVVTGITHPFDSQFVRFPDGRIVKRHNDDQGKDFKERRSLINRDLEIRIADVQFIVDQLEKLNKDPNSKFYKKLNSQIGIFGQSMGGSTAIQVCRRDSRIKAAVNMDGSLFGPDALKPFNKPLMFIIAGNTLEIFKNNPIKKEDWKFFGLNSLEEEKMVRKIGPAGYGELAKAIGKNVYILSIKNASHLDLASASILKEAVPFAKFLNKFSETFGIKFGIGSINGLRVNTIINDYLLNFFNKYLKGQPSALLDDKEQSYSEVEALST